MRYISTRGQSAPQSFCDILLGGLAPDGGLYLPESYPQFSETDLAAMRAMNYRELAFTILSRFADDIPAADLRDIVNRLHDEVLKALASPDVKERFTKVGADAWTLKPEAFDAYIKNEIASNAKLVKAAGLEPQ